jgi:hypothetical protein
MSVSYSSQLFIGVPMNQFVKKSEIVETKLSEYDKFGKPTGKMITVRNFVIVMPDNTRKVIASNDDGSDKFSFSFEEVFPNYIDVDINWGDFGIHRIGVLESNDDLSQYILGIGLIGLKMDGDNPVACQITDLKINQTKKECKEILVNDFGFEGEPELILTTTIS